MTVEQALPKTHKTILTVLLLLTIGMTFKLCNSSFTTRASTEEERYPSLYCKFHDCALCSDSRITVDENHPTAVFELRRTCMQWVVVPAKYGAHFDNNLSSVDL